MKTRKMLLALVTLITTPALAEAYVGPGAGLGLLAAFWAGLLAIGTVLMFLVAWPMRRLLRRQKAAASDEAPEHREASQTGEAPES